MAKKAYIGVGGVARKVKKMYLGIPAKNGIDEHTLLMLHGEDFTDSSENNVQLTNSGVDVSSAQCKFGSKCLHFDRGDYLTLPAIDFGNGDFTIDWWEYVTDATAGTRFSTVFAASYSSGAGGLLVGGYESTPHIWVSSGTNFQWDLVGNKPCFGTNAYNAWVHRAIVRSGKNLLIFTNGTLENTYDIGTSSIGFNENSPFCIGKWVQDYADENYQFVGYIDEFRISNVARWTENFTPMDVPYSADVLGSFARNVNKGYIGIGGVARPIWPSIEGIVNFGYIPQLTVARSQSSSAKTNNCLIIGGGVSSGNTVASVDAYNSMLTKESAPSLTNAKFNGAATNIGNNALFAGGCTRESTATDGIFSDVDVYNNNLTKTSATPLSLARKLPASVCIGNYAMFGGGHVSDGRTNAVSTTNVDAYNSSLTKINPTQFSVSRRNHKGATVGDYALFVGGNHDNSDNSSDMLTSIELYNASLTKIASSISLSASGGGIPGAVSTGNYALFLVRTDGIMNAFDKHLTRTIPDSPEVSRIGVSTTVLKEYALFCAGTVGMSEGSDTVDAYNEALTRENAPSLNSARCMNFAGTIGDYALIGGGYNSKGSSKYLNSVEAYTIL